MARKGRVFRTVLMAGGLAAAGVIAYKNRDLIRGFLDELTGAAGDVGFDYAPDTEEYFSSEDAAAAETDIIIDRSGGEGADGEIAGDVPSGDAGADVARE